MSWLSSALSNADIWGKEHETCVKTVVGALGFLIAWWQYRRSQAWKRAEFLAQEMKSFSSDPVVIAVTRMIDWSPRKIDILQTGSKDPDDYKIIDYALQARSLRPHVLTADWQPAGRSRESGADSSGDGELGTQFPRVETAIRDSYDRFFDYLERFGSYVESGLFSVRDLGPYLEYWLGAIASAPEGPQEALWNCVVFTYLDYYDYTYCQSLFRKFGHDVTVDGPLFNEAMARMETEQIGKDLRALAERRRLRSATAKVTQPPLSVD